MSATDKTARSSEITREKIEELMGELNLARSAVFVCTTALDTGDDHTDLEYQCGTTLRRASQELEGVYDKLLMLRLDAPSRPSAARRTGVQS
jgi:hypothetical protein